MTRLTESQARSMEAGEELDRICAGLHGAYNLMFDAMYTGKSHRLVRYSTEWSAAGPLLDAMGAWVDTTTNDAGLRDDMNVMATGDTGPHAIARLAAVCVALGITPEEARGE